MDRVLVTGATGTVGRHVVDALADRPAEVVIGARDPAAIDRTVAAIDRVTVVHFDFEDRTTWADALAGIDGVFLSCPPTVPTRTVRAVVDAIERAGVERVASLSTLGAGRNPLVPHFWIERRCSAATVDHTSLRASFFMQNLLAVHRDAIVAEDAIDLPAGGGAISLVDARDVAAAAAVVLTGAGHAGRAYDLTGPEALAGEAIAAVFSDVLDRPIAYADPSPVAFARRLHARGEPAGFVAITTLIYLTVRFGLADRVSADLPALLGRPPRDLSTFVADHADQFRPASD